ncbi:hypothetical protein VHEMI07017 [[Torrubiella] hemipterigena]|uniref:Zn(2)-C6 fungal-type domain-containing protein n=1 Tax=[Torrubiella] hemipterigena TaxID=1531966 RepID=A0A0A1TKI3_9HYPO|nr:hypothetical protein VHEMI07017 [[Torrubiella] hemipterigena]
MTMFGTLKYDAGQADLKVVRRDYDPVSAHSRKHQACNRCHSMKVHCNGDRDGCDRCSARNWKCTYTYSEYRPSKRSRRSRASSKLESPPREVSTPSTSLEVPKLYTFEQYTPPKTPSRDGGDQRPKSSEVDVSLQEVDWEAELSAYMASGSAPSATSLAGANPAIVSWSGDGSDNSHLFPIDPCLQQYGTEELTAPHYYSGTPHGGQEGPWQY